MKKNHAKLFKSLNNLLTNRDFFKDYLFNDNHFTRDRSLSFQTVVLLILRLLKSSLKTELKSFYEQVFKEDKVVNWVSDAALCKARQKIKYGLFEVLSKEVSGSFYDINKGDLWKGCRLLGVDGSEINLPSSAGLIRDFGEHHVNSVGTEIPQARVSFLTDVLNKVTLDASIKSFKVSEQAMLDEHLPYVNSNDLLTADANYGHFRILKKVAATGANYCFRVNKCSAFIKDFLASGKKDMILNWEPSKKTIENCRKNGVDETPMQVRVVRIELEHETEVLVTSLTDQQKYSYQDISKLYNMRWGTEEVFKKFMQRLMIEFFSSIKTNGVLQDFYANVFMLNAVSLLSYQSNKQVFENSKALKYRRCINWTSALGDVRQSLVLLFLRGVKHVEDILLSIFDSFRYNTEAIKPGRKFKRDKRKKGARKKAFICYKPAW